MTGTSRSVALAGLLGLTVLAGGCTPEDPQKTVAEGDIEPELDPEAAKLRGTEQQRHAGTRALLERLKVGLETYHAEFRDYPPDGYDAEPGWTVSERGLEVAEGRSVRGTGARLRAPDTALYIGNSGTSARFLTAAATLAGGPVLIDGNERMRERPIRDLADAHGHIQEVIVQPFHPKEATPMRGVEALPNEEVAGWIALARLVMGPDANVQAPPNLAPNALELLLRSVHSS